MERRALLQWMVASGGLAAFHRLSLHDLETLGADVHRQARAGRALDAAQQRVVAVAAERIIPATATPGATDADVTAFIDTMLADWYPDADRARFTAGLVALDAAARAAHGRVFVACTESQQVSRLQTFDAEVERLRSARDASANDHWFAMLKYLTVWGYCTSEVGMRRTLAAWPLPMRYDGNAPMRRRG
ncbi:MAG: gluconate 2-dehydrogenase subunit 3 family protein [Gemmatimonadaceae bacterium]|nr:gluconate 2-dehydrogenase subunit 3 family protein [Gemmatimonadaceae bacterium]